jgi:hypothetical protein
MVQAQVRIVAQVPVSVGTGLELVLLRVQVFGFGRTRGRPAVGRSFLCSMRRCELSHVYG